MNSFYHNAKNTFTECLREPIYLVLLLFALVLIAFFPAFTLFVFGEQVKLVIDSSMATTLIFGLISAVLCASHTISKEMRNGTVLLLLSKPIYKWSFIVSKIFGIFFALGVFVFLCNCGTIISLFTAEDEFRFNEYLFYGFLISILLSLAFGGLRNYLSHVSFSSNSVKALLVILPIFSLLTIFFGKEVEGISMVSFYYALCFIFFSVWIMCSISVALASRLDVVPNLIISFFIFSLGLVSNYFLAEGLDNSIIMTICYAIIPNWQCFWMADAISNNLIIPFSLFINNFLYMIMYVSLASICAVVLFQNKEIAKGVRQ